MSFSWYLRRLANMSLREILYRFTELRKRRQSRTINYTWSNFTSASRATIPGLRSRVLETLTDEVSSRIDRICAKLSAGHFAVHGVEWPERSVSELFPETIWRLDPITGGLWPGPDVYTFDILYRHERQLGDIKYVWDFNRLQFLQPLAIMAARGDRAALVVIEGAIESWFIANPPFKGIAWNSGIELALRSLSLVFVVSMCEEILSDRVHGKISTILSAHLFWINRYPSRFSSANNHLIAEATAEFVITSLLTDAPNASEIGLHARRQLGRQAEQQIYPDGLSAEQSPTYGAFSAEMLLFAVMVGDATKAPLDSIVSNRLKRFAKTISWLADGNGRVPAFGDDDEGRVLTDCDAHEACYPSSVAGNISAYFKEIDCGGPISQPCDIRDLTFGKLSGCFSSRQGIMTFENGGMTVIREKRAGCEIILTLDHGPLGYLSIAAHGHADANSVTLSIDDCPVLVDPGTYLYHSGASWRDWFRGTSAHNTLSIEGVNQSSISGPFNWSHKANAWLETKDIGENWSISSRHDGYRGRYKVDHCRKIVATSDGFKIIDRLLPKTIKNTVEINFQFMSNISLEPSADCWNVLQGRRVLMSIAFSVPGVVSIRSGQDTPSGGWVSPCFGKIEPAPRLTWCGTLGEAGLITFVSFISYDRSPRC